MLDMSWGEVMIIGAVALIVIGPKDLPRALRTIGNVTGKLRRMAAEFQGQFNEALREAELDDVKRQLQGMNDAVSPSNKIFNPLQTIRDELKNSIEASPPHPAASSNTIAPSEPLPAPPPLAEPPGLPLPPVQPVDEEIILNALNRQAEHEVEAAKAHAAENPDAKVVAESPKPDTKSA